MVGSLGILYNGWDYRYNESQREIISYENYPVESLYKQGGCFLELDQSFESFQPECGDLHMDTKFLVWGDSHAAALSSGLRENVEGVAQFTSQSCPPLIKEYEFSKRPNCKDVNNYIVDKIGQLQPRKVLLHANWVINLQNIAYLENTIVRIKEVSPSSEINIVGGVPQWRPSLPVSLLRSNSDLTKMKFLKFDGAEIRRTDEILSGIALANSVEFVSILKKLCVESECPAVVRVNNGGFEPIVWDYGHLTRVGSQYISSKIF